MKSDDKWVLFKNFLHNELGISKEDIREWLQEAVKEEAQKMIDKAFNDFDVKKVIEQSVLAKTYYKDDSVKEQIVKEVAKMIFARIEIKSEIN